MRSLNLGSKSPQSTFSSEMVGCPQSEPEIPSKIEVLLWPCTSVCGQRGRGKEAKEGFFRAQKMQKISKMLHIVITIPACIRLYQQRYCCYHGHRRPKGLMFSTGSRCWSRSWNKRRREMGAVSEGESDWGTGAIPTSQPLEGRA